MKFLAGSVFMTILAALEISPVSATPASCQASSVISCTNAIKTTKTRTASLTSWCSSVLGCVKSTTTITGDPVTVTTTKVVWETYTEDYIASEETTTTTFDYTETVYTEIATSTLTPTYTVERFAVITVQPRLRRWDEAVHAKDLLKRERTTSICSPAIEKQACSCILTTCAPPVTKDERKTIKEKTTETSYSFVENPITYTNIEYVPIITTLTESYTWTEISGVLSTHTTTIKCTPSSTNPSFYLQATDAPPVNGQYYWAAPLSPRPLSFSLEAAFTSDILEATVFSLDSAKRLITRHKNGTHYANVDPYSDFQLVHLATRGELQKRTWPYLRCEVKPASGRYPGGYGELYCLSDGFWPNDIWNYCPLYKEYFNAPLVIGTEWSETSPDCFPLVFLVILVCGDS